MSTCALKAGCYREPQKIVEIENIVHQLLLLALAKPAGLRVTIKDTHDSVSGVYRGITWCLTERGMACVLRLTPHGEERDAPIDVSEIEHIEAEAA